MEKYLELRKELQRKLGLDDEVDDFVLLRTTIDKIDELETRIKKTTYDVEMYERILERELG